jgi:hypothetical protein
VVGWIAVSWLGLVASFMFAAANYRSASTATPKVRRRGVLTAAALARRGLRQLVGTARAAATSATARSTSARTSC